MSLLRKIWAAALDYSSTTTRWNMLTYFGVFQLNVSNLLRNPRETFRQLKRSLEKEAYQPVGNSTWDSPFTPRFALTGVLVLGELHMGRRMQMAPSDFPIKGCGTNIMAKTSDWNGTVRSRRKRKGSADQGLYLERIKLDSCSSVIHEFVTRWRWGNPMRPRYWWPFQTFLLVWL
jgi:hypothetical protein